jgi:NAD(P)-dependent dehydrogenase (short-subunit alcohol dehydrogenase family)
VADESFVDSFAADLSETFGRLDYAVSCAGVLGDSLRTHETPLSVYNRIMDINLKGAWLASRAALNLMMKQDHLDHPGQRGAIVNIASQLGIVARPTAGTRSTSSISQVFSTNSKSALLRFQGGHN